MSRHELQTHPYMCKLHRLYTREEPTQSCRHCRGRWRLSAHVTRCTLNRSGLMLVRVQLSPSVGDAGCLPVSTLRVCRFVDLPNCGGADVDRCSLVALCLTAHAPAEMSVRGPEASAYVRRRPSKTATQRSNYRLMKANKQQ